MKIIVYLSFILFGTNVYSQDLLTIGALHAGSKDLLKSFTSDIDKISQKRFAEGFEMLELILSQIEGKLKDHMYTVKNDLSSEERELYNALERVYVTLSKSFEEAMKEIEEVTLTLSNTISDSWLVGNKKPFIKSITVPYISRSLNEEIEIIIAGNNLDVRRNYIQLDTNIYDDPRIFPNGKISFTIPKEHLQHLEVGKLPIKIYTFKNRRFNRKPYRIFDYDLIISPDNIGTIHFINERKIDQKVYDNRTFSTVKKKKANSKKKWKENHFTIRMQNRQDAAHNWKIDLKTVKIKKTQSADGGSDCDLYLGQSEDNFIKGRVKARGTGCCDYSAGTTKCRVTWKEYYVKKVSVYDTVSVDLEINMDTLIRVNKETFDFDAIVLEYGDGTKETFSSFSQITTLPIRIEPILEKKYIILKSK